MAVPSAENTISGESDTKNRDDAQRVLCAFNLSDRPASYALPAGLSAAIPIDGSGARGASVQGAQLRFEPWGQLFCSLS